MTIAGYLLPIFILLALFFAFSQPKKLVILMLATGPLAISVDFGNIIGGIRNISALWLLWLIICGLAALVFGRGHRVIRWSRFEKSYGLFLFWCAVMSLVADDYAFSLRMYLKLLYPLVIFLLAKRYIITEADRKLVLHWILGVTALAVLLGGGLTNYLLPPAARFGRMVFVGWAPFADFAALMSVLSLIGWTLFRQYRYWILYGLLAVSPVFYVIRTGILATIVGTILFFLFRERIYKSIPVILAIYVIGAASLFVIPSIREHMFFQPNKVDANEMMFNPGRVDINQINTHGRLDMWERALEVLFEPSPLTGSGLGACQALFYSGFYGEMKVVHNEFVRLLCDVGLIGLCLYGIMIVTCMILAWKAYRKATEPLARFCALFVLASLPALLSSMLFDNLFDYILYAGQYPFAFAGMMFSQPDSQQNIINPQKVQFR